VRDGDLGDDDLLRLAAQGRQDAIDLLLRQLRPVIVSYCKARLARMGCHCLNEDDVAQEVCLALLSALPSYRDRGKPLHAFVFGIAAHKVADAVRGATRATVIPMPDVPDQPDGHLGPEEALLQRTEATRALVLLATLPAGQRRLILLRVMTGLSAEETGYVLDMTPGAVRVAQHRALARLRQLAAEQAA
jgi:RNA polymerase sigma-70 factor, ECF subfamily